MQGGVLRGRDRYFQTKHREEALERYGHKCIVCGAKEDLEIHHIIDLANGGPESIDNLIPLCPVCHKLVHGNQDTIHRAVKYNRGGRKVKVPFEEFDKWFGKYLAGEIGKRKFLQETGYCFATRPKDNPNIQRSMKERGIKSYRNNIDIRATNSVLKEGDIVGCINYTDGRKEYIYFHDTGLNDVDYVSRAT